ncbi:protein of unknown function [Hydrobacter penzbergensis]|uniref:eCIS core domain-containing protein n=1 Tax=Hydrobacter penzbergensis TaxID=1235997 RepID=A0A8X8LF46_9BACT|nr:DUF4157 domain-containing protein [Hydrobacter penzbergensis]SDX51097.1 protein of unknown function [Hydrobacter penzbergensis]
MATIFKRRRRRSITANEGKFFKKENTQEQSFFSGADHDGFFQPQPQTQQVQRKCAECENEEKKAQRMTDDKKEEDKTVHRETDKKEDDDKKLHRQADGAATASGGAASYVHSLNGKGSPLPASTKQFFQQRMGVDFSQVAIHTEKEASDSAKAINAKAYTVGNHIVFKEGQYAPDTYEGKKLLAHELTHVVQQAGAIMRKVNPVIHEDDDKTALRPVSGKGTLTDNKTNNGTSADVSAQTTANYDHGTFTTANATSTRATGCSDCGSAPCATMSGVMISVFHAHPVIAPPVMPPGLTPCQQLRVQHFINNVLMPHERQHVAAFNTYNGTVRTPFTVTACHTDQGLSDALLPLHNSIDASRIAAANALSDALDPFNTTIDIDCQEPKAPASPSPKKQQKK